MAAAAALVGKYVFDRSENVDEYLEYLGCGLVVRKVYSVMRPTLEITFDPSTVVWNLTMESPFYKYELDFKLGKYVEDDETFDIRKCRIVIFEEENNGAEEGINNGTLLMTQIPDKGPQVKTRIEKWSTGFVKIEMKSGDKTAVQVFRSEEMQDSSSTAAGGGGGGVADADAEDDATNGSEDLID